MKELHANYIDAPWYGVEKTVLIVGIGAVGKNTVEQLASLGSLELAFYDDDKVSENNFEPQGYHRKELNVYKVTALRKILYGRRFTNFQYHAIQYHKNCSIFNATILINAADSMTCRKDLFSIFLETESVELYIDVRMAGEYFDLYYIRKDNQEAIEEYSKTLFSSEEASDIPCGYKSTRDVSMLSGCLISQYIKAFISNQKLNIDGILRT